MPAPRAGRGDPPPWRRRHDPVAVAIAGSDVGQIRASPFARASKPSSSRRRPCSSMRSAAAVVQSSTRPASVIPLRRPMASRTSFVTSRSTALRPTGTASSSGGCTPFASPLLDRRVRQHGSTRCRRRRAGQGSRARRGRPDRLDKPRQGSESRCEFRRSRPCAVSAIAARPAAEPEAVARRDPCPARPGGHRILDRRTRSGGGRGPG